MNENNEQNNQSPNLTSNQSRPPRPAPPPPRPAPPPKPVDNVQSEEVKKENIEEINEPENLEKEEKKSKKIKINISKKAIIISVIAFITAIILGVSIFLIVNVIKESKKIETPTNLTVYKFDEKVYLKTDENARAEKYLFKRIFNNKEITILSDVAGIDLSPYLLEAGEYKFTVQYLGKRDKADSNFCKMIVYENYIDLNAPTIVHDDETNKLVWIPVENATSYNIHFISPLGSANSYSFDAPVGKDNVEFDLSEIFSYNVAGSYEISVEAVGETYFNNSPLSNKIIVNNGTQLLSVSNIEYSNQTRILKFDSDAQTNKFSIKITLDQYEDNIIELTYKGENSTSKQIDLSTYINGSVKTIEIVALGDGVYTFNSNVTSVEIE